MDNVDATCKTVASVDGPSQTCVFPFVYQSVLYTHCTVVDHNRPWCATATNAAGQFIKDAWGACDLDRCEIGGEACQLHTMNAPWSNAETRTLSEIHTSSSSVLGPCTAHIRSGSDNPTSESALHWSPLLIGTFCSVVLNILLFVYAIWRDRCKRATPIEQPRVHSTKIKYDTPRATMTSVCSSASL